MSDPLRIPRGPVMLDVEGIALTEADRRRLAHPAVGGVILFARNYASPDQVRALALEIRALREPRLLLAVDHEGGRVQRFRAGFSPIPPMARLGRLWDADPAQGLAAARDVGLLIASELTACGIDFSFTPVLDLDYGPSGVIGDRAFHRDPQAVAALAGAVLAGLRTRGVAAVGKHFPGHGFVAADSHTAVPVDERSLAQIEAQDLLPYAALIGMGLAAVMPAHVIYPRVDGAPAGFSRVWLQDILRGRLGFRGVIFSDDLSMEGAAVAGGIVQRAHAALTAGCDVVLVCNRPDSADELLAGLHWQETPGWNERVRGLAGSGAAVGLATLQSDPGWQAAHAALERRAAALG
jgi:beta-N-acetylhexosaminidase